MKTFLFTLAASGIFSTSLFTTGDFILSKKNSYSKLTSYFVKNFDANSRATKTRSK